MRLIPGSGAAEMGHALFMRPKIVCRPRVSLISNAMRASVVFDLLLALRTRQGTHGAHMRSAGRVAMRLGRTYVSLARPLGKPAPRS